MEKRRVGIIGATGSVGVQAINVIEQNADMFDVVFITAHNNLSPLKTLGKRVNAQKTVLTADGFGELQKIIDDNGLDIAIVAASGAAIIPIVYQLACKGIRLGLANKECIVSAGRQIMHAVATHGSTIIPVDSEHSALFQCMAGNNKGDISKLILTASGGAFRDFSAEMLKSVKVKDAIVNPNWKMGRKITIDSATMMNKGLELIEARMLFDIPPDRLQVVVHPQSIVHSMVAYDDGAVMAQLSVPDMRLPISYALGYPNRIPSGVAPLDFTKAMELTFYPPDMKKYRCLDIALRVLNEDLAWKMIVLNAANEVAVEYFLKEELSFDGIGHTLEEVLGKVSYAEPTNIEEVLFIDEDVRVKATEQIKI